MNQDLESFDARSVAAPDLPPALVFHARGFLGHALTGLGIGGMMLAIVPSLWRDAFANAPPDPNALAITALAAAPVGSALIGLLLFAIGLIHCVRMQRKPRAFRMDGEGVEGFLLFGRRRIAWREITEVKYQGAWIHLHAGKRKLYINPSQLLPVDGNDPAALINYFLQGVLRRV